MFLARPPMTSREERTNSLAMRTRSPSVRYELPKMMCLITGLLEVGDDGVAVVLNDCGHPALQATVVLDSGRQFVAEAGPVDIVPFGKIALDAKSAIEEHFEIVRSHPAEYPHRQGPVMFSGGPGSAVSVEFRAHLRWRTEQDIPRNDVVEVVLRHQMTYDGLQRIENRDE